jgi:lysozyme
MGGKMCAGYGHDFQPGEPVPAVCTQEQCDAWFATDFALALAHAKVDVPCFDSLNEARQACLIDMAYELGEGGLAQFKKMIMWIEKGYFQQAALEMGSSLWAKQVRNRELEDAAIMQTGQFPS